MTIKQAGIHGNDIHKVLCGSPLKKNKHLFLQKWSSGQGMGMGKRKCLVNIFSSTYELEMEAHKVNSPGNLASG